MKNLSNILAVCITFPGALGCAITSHSSAPAELGVPATESENVGYAEMVEVAQQPGEVQVTQVTSADWEVDRAGLINLAHPKAEAAGLESGDEPIAVQFFGLQHPKHGLYLVDTGVAESFRSEDTAPASWLVRSAMNFESLEVKTDTKSWLSSRRTPLRGVFVTHLHVDHIMGLRDIPRNVPLYTGPGESDGSRVVYLFSQGVADDMLEGFGALQELNFSDASTEMGEEDGELVVLDVFGDRLLFALHVPGHTPGSLAFLVRTPVGPQLIAGDACHTSWGWKHGVEPGEFNQDTELSAVSLRKLKKLESDLPGLHVYPGHQHLH